MAKPIISLDIGENVYDPMVFVESAVYGEELGFKRLWYGDHFMPWYHSSDRSSFVWSVVASCLDRTKKVELGPLVTTPIGARYHPALVAQACATLDNMYPGRLLVSVGAGEAVNEVPFWNGNWPGWQERMDRLCEGLVLMEKLWNSDRHFSFKGRYFSAPYYQMYTRPKTPLEIYFSAVGPKAAYAAGRYGDHLVTLCPGNDPERIKNVIWPQFQRGQKEAKKKGGGLVAHIDFSFETAAEIYKTSRNERTPWVKDAVDIKDPIALEKATKTLTVERIAKNVHSVKSWDQLIKVLDGYVKVGATELILSASPEKKDMEGVAKNVLPSF